MGGGGRCQGVGGRRPLEILLLGLGISFVLPRTLLHRVLLYRGSAVPRQHLTLKILGPCNTRDNNMAKSDLLVTTVNTKTFFFATLNVTF